MRIKRLTYIPHIVYHGSTTEHMNSLEDIRIDMSRKDLDFGRGFYTTSVKKQAIEWAYGKSSQKYKPFLLTINVNIDIIKALNGKIFEFPDDDWTRVIYNNRFEIKDDLFTYDFVYGHLADGLMNNLIQEINDGLKGYDDFKRDIIPKYCKYYYYDQLVFKSNISLNYINVVKREVLQNEI